MIPGEPVAVREDRKLVWAAIQFLPSLRSPASTVRGRDDEQGAARLAENLFRDASE